MKLFASLSKELLSIVTLLLSTGNSGECVCLMNGDCLFPFPIFTVIALTFFCSLGLVSARDCCNYYCCLVFFMMNLLWFSLWWMKLYIIALLLQLLFSPFFLLSIDRQLYLFSLLYGSLMGDPLGWRTPLVRLTSTTSLAFSRSCSIC